jgi:hypothetical protein
MDTAFILIRPGKQFNQIISGNLVLWMIGGAGIGSTLGSLCKNDLKTINPSL